MKNKMALLPRHILLLLMLPVWCSCVKTYSTATDLSLSPQRPGQTLVDYLNNNYAFSMFYAALKKTGLDRQLDSVSRYTLLLPDNDAFARVGITLDSLMGTDSVALRKWMGFHVIRGAIGYDSVPQTVDNVFYSILGQKIFLSKPISQTNQQGQPIPRTLHADGVAVNSFDIRASNGYIQVLNTPLNAPLEGTLQDLINAHPDQFSLFKAALQKFGLWDRLATDTAMPLTVFAPVNSAFQNLTVYDPDQHQYVPYTITEDTIAAWDVKEIPADVFGVYLFPGRIFTSDYMDAPTAGLYIMPDQLVSINFLSSPPSILAALIDPNTYRLKQLSYSPPASILSPADLTTLNGNNVLQPVDGLLMIP